MTFPTDGLRSNGEAETVGRIVVALFTDRSDAAQAIRDLKSAGFTSEQIGVATQDQDGATSRQNPAADEGQREQIVQDTASGMAEGAGAGALTGGVIGALLGLIGSLLVPGLGPVVVGGVLASTLMGAGVGAATGGLIGALIGMGVPEEDARYFDTGLRQGGTLVTVNAGNRTPEAASILDRHDADLGPSRASARSSQYDGRERRHGDGKSYTGPERRLVEV